jgi:hypothetical protein
MLARLLSHRWPCRLWRSAIAVPILVICLPAICLSQQFLNISSPQAATAGHDSADNTWETSSSSLDPGTLSDIENDGQQFPTAPSAAQASPLQPKTPAQGQVTTYPTPSEQQGILLCPGGFPTDLTMTDCAFTQHQRFQQWITTSFTDQAILGAFIYGLGSEILRTPNEWPRTWLGLGDRVGVRYTQAAARGTAEYLMGSLLQDDPRHLSYKDDPHTPYGTKVVSCENGELTTRTYAVGPPAVGRRIGHAFLDSVTVLKSSSCGNGKRMPAYTRLVGIAAGVYGGYGWNPGPENSIGNVSERAVLSYASTLVGSFYTEFSPELMTALTKLITSHKKAP